MNLTGSRSGVVRSVRLEPEQAVEVDGLWASADDLQITGSEAQVKLLVHGERSVKLGSANGRYTGGVEYVADLNAHTSAVIDPAPLKIPEGENTPPVHAVSSYRPGEPAAGDHVKVQGPLYRGAVGRSVQVSGSQFLLERGGPCAAS